MKNKEVYYLTKRDIQILERRNKCIQNENDTLNTEFIFDTYQAANARLLEAQNILKQKDCQITHLEVRQNQMNDHKIELLAAAIEGNNSIQNIVFSRCRLRSSQLKLICESICKQKGKPLQNLQIKEFSITKKGGEAIAKVLSECINLTKLTLYQTKLDTETLVEICNGLKQSKSLEYLDLRKNQITSEGLSALITALSEHRSLKQLCFEGLRIKQNDAKLLAQFLKQEECKIEQLELNEANLDKNSLDLIFEALYKDKILQKLSLAKNYFTDSMYESLSQTTIQLDKLKNLCLSRCDLSSEALKIICESLKSKHTRVQNLDLSWNNISGEDIILVNEMLTYNISIEKLQIQHNFIGEEGVKYLVQAIALHENLKYLDISANEISSQGFELFADVLSKNPILHSLHVRKNQIEDIEVLESIVTALKQNSNLFYLDLKDNEIDDEGAQKLLELIQENHYIEDIVVGGNPKISLVTISKIADECKKNIQIKDYILPYLIKKESKAQGGDGLPNLKRRISTLNVQIRDQYSIEELNLTNAKYNKSDFIVKFIQLTKDDLQVLDFCKVNFSSNMTDLTEYLSKGISNISRLTLEECDIGDTPLTQLILGCRVMASLRELRLVRLPRLATHTKEILQSLQNHKYLNFLDLRDNNIQSMSEIARLLANNQFLNEINLKGNNISSLNDFREILSGLSQNLSVTKLIYDIDPSLITIVKVSRYKDYLKTKDGDLDKNGNKQIEYLDPQEHRLLEDQLGMNEYIQTEIIPTQQIYNVKGTNTVDMSGKDVGIAIDAVIKYFSVQHADEGRGFTKKTRLVLNHCKLKEKHINLLVGGLLKLQKFDVDLLDLSHNDINDKACQYLAGILQSNKKLKQLILGKNQKITAEGFKELSKGLKKNTQLEVLDLSACFIELRGEEDWLEIQQELSSNCRLVQLDLIGNDCDLVFMKELQNQLAQNKQIQEYIVAQIVKKNEEMRQIRRETRRRQKSMSKDFDIQSNVSHIIKQNGDDQKHKKASKNQKSNGQTCVSVIPFGKEIAAFFGDSSDEEEKNTKSDTEDNHGGLKHNFKRRTSSIYKLKNPKNKMDGGMDSQFPKSLNFEPIVGIKDDEKKAQSDNENSEDENPFEAAKAFDFSQVQKLSLRGKNLQSLDFLTKFMRENPNIVDIDLGDNPLSANEIDKFSKNLKQNKSVRNLGLDGIKNLNQSTKTIINDEIKKNELIQDIISKNMSSQNGSKRQMLKLQGQAIKDVGFIHKFLQGYKNLKVLDLTDNRLGNKGAEEIRALIQDSKTIESLILQNNKIGSQGLQHICSGLSVNKSIKYVDIRDNIIQDESLKPLLAVLYANDSITNIRYSVTSEENIERLKKFKQISHWEPHKIEEHFNEHDEHHHHLHWWQKICLPLWCWKSLIHDKHEAFRFKYDTKALRIIEEELMDEMTIALYINNIVYYFIMFICPQIFVAPCAEGYNNISHVIYVIFGIWSIFLEIYFVLKIQKRLNNKRILKFNKWHFVELLFGSIARFDTYLDMCFFNLLHACDEYKLSLPVIFLIVVNFTYPLYTLIKLMHTNQSYNHTLPRIERNCRLAFIRENMLLATVLDSFCIDNNVEVCQRPTHQGRIMAVWTLLTQDGPQYCIHLVFIFLVHTDIPHSEFTVLTSLVVSTFAVQISTFNLIMCEPNEFDPILLQIELKKRQDDENRREKILITQREEWKKGIEDPGKKNTLNTLNEIGAQMSQNFKAISQSHEKKLQSAIGSVLEKNQESKHYLEVPQETTRNNDESAAYMTNISRI